MAGVFRFRDFPVYKDTRNFRTAIKQLSRKKFPREEQYCLTSQLWRALDSILLNIAEGAERYTDIDFSRYLNNSIGSLGEVVGCLDCAVDDGYLSESEHSKLLSSAESLARQLKAFAAKVRKDGRIGA